MNGIVVFCGSSSGIEKEFAEDAYKLGTLMAEEGIHLIYGGAKIGIMGQVAQGALNANGTVIGVIPKFLMKKEVYHPELSELIITKDMHERKLKMHGLSQGIIMLPGGYGTLEEFFEMLTWAQLGLHRYPIGILNTKGFYDPLLTMLKEMVQKGFVKQENFEMILVSDSCSDLLQKMRKYEPIPVPKWLNKDQL